MAYIGGNMTADELQKQQGLTQVTTPGGGGILGAGGVGARGTIQQSPSGSWTNLKSYLAANAPQAQALAQRVTPQITQMGEEAKSQLERGVAGYGTELAKSIPNLGLIQEAAASPTSIVSDPTKLAQFRAMQQGSMLTPSEFAGTTGYGEALTAAQRGAGLGGIAESEGGKQELLRKLSPSMTKGAADLNMLLLQGNPQAREMIAAAARPYAGLTDYLKQQEQALEQQRQAVIGEQKAATGKVEEQFTKPQTRALREKQSELQKRQSEAAAEQERRSRLTEELYGYLSGTQPTISAEARQIFNPTGVKALIQQAIPGGTISIPVGPGGASGRVPLTTIKQDVLDYYRGRPQEMGKVEDFISHHFPGVTRGGGAAPTMAGVTTPEEYARTVALQNLVGNLTPFLTEAEQAQAGTFRQPTLSGWVA